MSGQGAKAWRQTSRGGCGRLQAALRAAIGLMRRSVEMSKQIVTGIYVVAMIAVIVGVDVAFFRDRFWARLIANIGIVLVFAAFYLRFIRST